MRTDNNIYNQAAAVPFLTEKGRVRILLITSRKSGNWIFPKGLIEPGDSPVYTAMKEAMEEAGISGEIIPEVIFRYRYPKWDGLCHVSVYPLRVSGLLKHFEEERERKRHWFELDEAVAAVQKTVLKEALTAFKEYHLKQG